jgi:hypothetical protein
MDKIINSIFSSFILFFLFSILLLSACSTPFSPEEMRKRNEEIQRRRDSFREPPPPPADHMLLYLYVNQVGSGTWSYYVDDIKVASLGNHQFTWVYVKTGSQEREVKVHEDGIIFNHRKLMQTATFKKNGEVSAFRFMAASSTSTDIGGRKWETTRWSLIPDSVMSFGSNLHHIRDFCDFVRPEVSVIP